MSYIADTIKLPTIFGTYRLQIIADDDPTDPREWDNLGTMICWHERYNLGDHKDNHYSDEESFFASLAGEDYETLFDRYYDRLPGDMEYVSKCDTAIQLARERISKLARQRNVLLPLYLYDHSGITMSTGRFSCPWDSGQVGWIYVSHEAIRKEYGWKKLTKKRLEKIESYLMGEVETYDQYLTGDVYGFKLFAPPTVGALADNEIEEDDINDKNIEDVCEEVDSCWGFFGRNWKENGMADHVAIEHEVRRRVAEHVKQLKTWIRNRVPLLYRKPLYIVH